MHYCVPPLDDLIPIPSTSLHTHFQSIQDLQCPLVYTTNLHWSGLIGRDFEFSYHESIVDLLRNNHTDQKKLLNHLANNNSDMVEKWGHTHNCWSFVHF